jgi:two-component system, NtrC family, sensor kinase
MSIPDDPIPVGSISSREMVDAVNSAKLTTLGLLVAGVAHEVNTPLGALASNHDVLKRALGKLQEILADEVVDEHELGEVRRIVRALDGILRVNDLAMTRVGELVGSLRSFGRPDRADRDTVDVHDGIETALTLLRHRLEGRITIDRDFGDLPAVECFPQQLHQVFMNLLLNAVQAVEGGGLVRVRTRQEGDHVVVEVEDTGPGIRADLLERIFEPGFTTKGNRVGMGLGLLIARQVVDRHGGSLEAGNRNEGGARFRVRLPVKLGRDAGEGTGELPPSPSRITDDAHT